MKLMDMMGKGIASMFQPDLDRPESPDDMYVKDEDASPSWDEDGQPKGSQWGLEPEVMDTPDSPDSPTLEDVKAIAMEMQQQRDLDRAYQDSVLDKNIERDQKMLKARGSGYQGGSGGY